MNEEALNMSTRKFLKKVGVTSQREIETAVRAAADKGALPGSMSVRVVLMVADLDVAVTIDGTIETE
jgi:hypothetical protein